MNNNLEESIAELKVSIKKIENALLGGLNENAQPTIGLLEEHRALKYEIKEFKKWRDEEATPQLETIRDFKRKVKIVVAVLSVIMGFLVSAVNGFATSLWERWTKR